MPLAFLVPAFLAGLAALAIPLWIHLTRRHVAQTVEFPSLMFVRRLPQESVKRRRFRDLLLLALRAAALGLIVVAFARPYLDRPSAVAPVGGGREVAIVVDRSYSMGYGERWERAVRAVERVIEELEGGDRATLIAFDEGAEAVVRGAVDRELLRAALAEQRPRAGRTRAGPALRLAESVLASSPLPRRELVLVSDFQRTAWEAPDVRSLRLPAGTSVTPISVAESDAANLAVTSVRFERGHQAGRERVTVSARVVNRGARAFRDIPVSLVLGERALETRSVSLEPDASAEVRFSTFTLSAPGTRGSVRVSGDRLETDNVLRFVLSPDDALGILVVESPSAPRDASLYLERALGIGGEPGFRVDVRRSLSPTDLEGRAVVVLNDAPLPEGEPGERLRAFVQSGGGLVVLSGPTTARAGWGRGATELLGSLVGDGQERRDEAGAALGYVDYGHPIFEIFRTPRSGDLTAARFFAYRSLQPSATARVLARFGDGSPALAEGRVGRGRVLAWSSTLGGAWNDLALQPVFLPFVHRLMRHAAGHTPPAAWLTVGQVLDPQRAPGQTAPGWLLTPAGERIRIRGAEPLRLSEQGFYELRRGAAGEESAQVVAVNVDPSESDLTATDPAGVASALITAGRADAGVAGPTSPRERERGQRAWWYLLLIAGGLLLAETMLGNRHRRAAL